MEQQGQVLMAGNKSGTSAADSNLTDNWSLLVSYGKCPCFSDYEFKIYSETCVRRNLNKAEICSM
jgi:hypothetical protein